MQAQNRFFNFKILFLLALILVLSRNGFAENHSIKVNVSGLLSSSTLKIKNNGVNEKIITTNGLVAFTTNINQNEGYAITVSTQPVGQTCIPDTTNAIGIATAEVIVAVSCTPNSYNVGGNVSGLIGTLVIKNGTNEKMLILNGAYNFKVNFKEPLCNYPN